MSSFKVELHTTQDAAINCLSHATRNKGLIKKIPPIHVSEGGGSLKKKSYYCTGTIGGCFMGAAVA